MSRILIPTVRDKVGERRRIIRNKMDHTGRKSRCFYTLAREGEEGSPERGREREARETTAVVARLLFTPTRARYPGFFRYTHRHAQNMRTRLRFAGVKTFEPPKGEDYVDDTTTNTSSSRRDEANGRIGRGCEKTLYREGTQPG